MIHIAEYFANSNPIAMGSLAAAGLTAFLGMALMSRFVATASFMTAMGAGAFLVMYV